MSFRSVISVSAMVLSLSLTSFAIAADDKDKAAAVTDEDGKYFDADGNPTFKIEEDGAAATAATIPIVTIAMALTG